VCVCVCVCVMKKIHDTSWAMFLAQVCAYLNVSLTDVLVCYLKM